MFRNRNRASNCSCRFRSLDVYYMIIAAISCQLTAHRQCFVHKSRFVLIKTRAISHFLEFICLKVLIQRWFVNKSVLNCIIVPSKGKYYIINIEKGKTTCFHFVSVIRHYKWFLKALDWNYERN